MRVVLASERCLSQGTAGLHGRLYYNFLVQPCLNVSIQIDDGNTLCVDLVPFVNLA